MTESKSKRTSAGLSRDVKKKMVSVHPALWNRIEEIAYAKLGLEPDEIRLTNSQILTALIGI